MSYSKMIYIAANRTLEVYKNLGKTLWLYNDKGLYFYLFNKEELRKYLSGDNNEPLAIFEKEDEMDNYLSNLKLI